MAEKKSKISPVLRGLVVSSSILGDAALANAAFFLNKVKEVDVHDSDVLIYRLIQWSVVKQVILNGKIVEDWVKQQPVPQQDQISVLARFLEETKNSVDQRQFQVLVESITLDIQKAKFVDRVHASITAIDGEYVDETTRVHYSGLDGALELAADAVSISSVSSADRFPSGDIRKDRVEVLAEYEDAKKNKGIVKNGVMTGFPSIDNVTGGISFGELVLFGAATGEGKSMSLANMSWYASVVAGKNVVVVTAETLRRQYRRRVLSRHSMGISGICKWGVGAPISGIKGGKLEPGEELAFQQCVDDFSANPNYGYFNIMQVTCGATMSDIRRELEVAHREAKGGVDVLFIDYLSLLAPTRYRKNRQEEIVQILREAKELALTFAGGRGIAIVSAHQMGADARAKVKPQAGSFFSIRDFADTSEAGKSADVAIALLRTDELKALHKVCCGFLKCRDSDVGPPFELVEDYRYAFLMDCSCVIP